MGGKRRRLSRSGWWGWIHVRPAVWCATAGGILSLITVILGLLNAVSAQQAVALAMPATLVTESGIIGLIVPDVWAAWRRGFQEGVKVAKSSQAHWRPDTVNSDAAAADRDKQAVTRLVARGSALSRRRTQPGDRR
jgi:hypothetical protein